MRGRLGPILIGIGGILAGDGGALPVWGYPELAVAPIDQDSVTTLSATGATVFDTAHACRRCTTDLTISAKTVGDIDASEEAGDDVRVWVSSSSTKDSDGIVRSRNIDRAAFDAYTAEAVNCCGEYTENEEGEHDAGRAPGPGVQVPVRDREEDLRLLGRHARRDRADRVRRRGGGRRRSRRTSSSTRSSPTVTEHARGAGVRARRAG